MNAKNRGMIGIAALLLIVLSVMTAPAKKTPDMATEQQCRVSSIDAAEDKRIVHLYCGRAEDLRITINEAGDTQFAPGQRFRMRLTLEGIQ